MSSTRPSASSSGPSANQSSPAKRSTNSKPAGPSNPAASSASPARSSSAPPTKRSVKPATSGQPESARSQQQPVRARTMVNTPSKPSIPFAAGDAKNKKHRDNYERLAKYVETKVTPENKPRILVYTDVEQDYDDLLAFIFLVEMHRMGAVELAGIVTNVHPALPRAKFLRTVLRLLGRSEVPVAVGTDGREIPEAHKTKTYYGLKNKTFEDAPWNNDPFESGARLIERLAVPTKRPLTVLFLSSLQDIGEYFDRHKKDPEHLRKNFHKFVSQGGYEVEQTTEHQKVKVNVKPVPAMNNDYHTSQARNYCATLARFGLPSDAWSREAAKAARLPAAVMHELFNYGPIGAHLKHLWMRQEFKYYWDPFNWRFMPFAHVPWYLGTRLGMDPNSEPAQKIVKNGLPFHRAAAMIKPIAYDCCAAIGAVGDDFMRDMGILGNLPGYNQSPHHNHRVFGKAPNDLGGVVASRLASVMETFLLGSLRATCADANKLQGGVFQKLHHERETSRFELDFFINTMMPIMKPIQDHEIKAAGLVKAAKQAKQEGKNREYEAMMKEAEKERREAMPLKVELSKLLECPVDKIPTRDDIPYEELYQVAMREAAAVRTH